MSALELGHALTAAVWLVKLGFRVASAKRKESPATHLQNYYALKVGCKLIIFSAISGNAGQLHDRESQGWEPEADEVRQCQMTL